jgi:hypothetical protein
LAALTITTIYMDGISSVDHLALAKVVNNPHQQEENKDAVTIQDDDEQLSLSTSGKEGEYDDANIASSTINGQKVCRKGKLLLIIMIQADTIYYLDAKR